jgi:hypothetical protein
MHGLECDTTSMLAHVLIGMSFWFGAGTTA